MAKYVCVELVDGTCQKWQEYSNSLDMLAITETQADLITWGVILMFIGGYKFRAIVNIILQRRY